MELLLDRGATIEKPGGVSAVAACLRNGREMAAQFLAGKGARLDLEGAAGLGELAEVKRFFTETGALLPTATAQQRADGFKWACGFGRSERGGVPVGAWDGCERIVERRWADGSALGGCGWTSGDCAHAAGAWRGCECAGDRLRWVAGRLGATWVGSSRRWGGWRTLLRGSGEYWWRRGPRLARSSPTIGA